MVEVIVREKRKTKRDGTEVWEHKKVFSKYFSPISGDGVQVSYNNSGHLVMRLWKKGEEGKETLIVFNMHETLSLLDFLKRRVC